MADQNQQPQTAPKKAAKPEMEKHAKTGLPVVKATGFVPIVVIKANAAEGFMRGEVRGLPPKVADRAIKAGAVKLYDFDNPANNVVSEKDDADNE